MADETIVQERTRRLKDMMLLLKDIDSKLMSLSKELNWNYENILQEKPSHMVICSFNSQHKVSPCKIKSHEEKCFWLHQGYMETDRPFPEYSGSGSCVTLTPELVHSITQKVTSSSSSSSSSSLSSEEKFVRPLPQTSANFDENFKREEKLAIYDYVIANTQNQKSYSDLWLQPVEKTKEKKEMAAWEIAAAERDAKRRRASYRNKVHTNRKTHTEILREVINSQMEAFELEKKNEKSKEKTVTHNKSYNHDSRESLEKRKDKKERNREERRNRKSHERHSKYRDHKRSSPIGYNPDTKSGSRSEEKYRKWKTHEGRSQSHRSGHSHRR